MPTGGYRRAGKLGVCVSGIADGGREAAVQPATGGGRGVVPGADLGGGTAGGGRCAAPRLFDRRHRAGGVRGGGVSGRVDLEFALAGVRGLAAAAYAGGALRASRGGRDFLPESARSCWCARIRRNWRTCWKFINWRCCWGSRGAIAWEGAANCGRSRCRPERMQRIRRTGGAMAPGWVCLAMKSRVRRAAIRG